MATACWSRSATPARAFPTRSSATSSSRSTPPSRSAKAPASAWTSVGGSSCSATAATCVSPRPRATPASRCCCPRAVPPPSSGEQPGRCRPPRPPPPQCGGVVVDDDGRLQRCLVGRWFVQGGSADAEPPGEPAHRQRRGPLLQQLPRGHDDLAGAGGERLHGDLLAWRCERLVKPPQEERTLSWRSSNGRRGEGRRTGRAMARCVTCGSELHPERAEKYDYCTDRECQERNAKALTILALGVNKAADQYQILDERTQEKVASGDYVEEMASGRQDRRRVSSGGGRRRREGARSPVHPTRARRNTATSGSPRRPWTDSQQDLALIYNARGVPPHEIAEKLGLSTYTVTQMILEGRRQAKP